MFDFKLYDLFSSQTQTQKTSATSNVVLVDIDEKSLDTLGQWPWPRVMLANLISKLNNSHPSAIGVDIIFPEKDRTSPKEISLFYKRFYEIDNEIVGIPKYLQDNDAILANILRYTHSVTSVYLSDEKISTNECKNLESLQLDPKYFSLKYSPYILCNTPAISKINQRVGFINTNIEVDGILRKMPLLRSYNNTIIPTLSLAMLLSIDTDLQVLPKPYGVEILNHRIRTDKHSEVLLNFYEQSWYKKISAIDILNDQVDKNTLQGKILIIGSSAAALHDRVIVSGGRTIIGAQVHITMIDNILNDQLIVQPYYYQYINIFLSLFLTFLLFFLLIKKQNNLILVLFISTLLLSALVTVLALKSGVYISIGYLIAPFLIHFFVVSILYIIIDTYERKVFSEELNRSHVALLDSMVHVAEVHDIETGAHIIRTKKYIKHLAEHMHKKGVYAQDLSPTIIEMMYRTAPLHDIGKVGIEDAILKKPTKLTPIEYEVMKTHAELGMHIINNAISSYKENDFFIMARNIAHYHHEKWDGTGYPKGLKGTEIPLESRFMALADVYDALVSKRVYKESFSYEKTLQIIIDGRGKHFDPFLVDAFIEIEDQFREIAQTYLDK